MKKLLAVQLCVLILATGIFSGMVATTSIYSDVHDRIVTLLCLSCIKLEYATQRGFNFTTANNASHPQFVLDNLSKGPVFLAYRSDACDDCDIMEPILKDIFSVEFAKQDTVVTTVDINGTNVTFIHISLDHSVKELCDSFPVYDSGNVSGVPMFTIITINYDHGFVKPYYATVYGLLNLITYEERKSVFLSIIHDGSMLYHENHGGYHTG